MPVRKAAQPGPEMLRIGRLAELAGVPAPTIKHYVAEGLLPRPVKTGRTSAYYHPDSVARVKLIKRLQREQFLPLDVIRRILDSPDLETPGDLDRETQLGRRIAGVGRGRAREPSRRPMTRTEVLAAGHCSAHMLDRMAGLGLVTPRPGAEGPIYSGVDLETIDLALGHRRRTPEEDDPARPGLETMAVYARALEWAVERDVAAFVGRVLTDESPAEALDLAGRADDLLDRFMILHRGKLLRKAAGEAVGQWNRLRNRLDLLRPGPLPGRHLPDKPPTQPGWRLVWHFVRGEYPLALELALDDSHGRSGEAMLALTALGETQRAVTLAEEVLRQPTARTLDNLGAALAYTWAAAARPGFVEPLGLARPAITLLKRLERLLSDRADDGGSLAVVDRLALSVIGAVYLLLPRIFGFRPTGLELLEAAAHWLERGAPAGRLPRWFRLTLINEIAPRLEMNALTLTAEERLENLQPEMARPALERLADLAGPDTAAGSWAARELKRIAGPVEEDGPTDLARSTMRRPEK